MLDGWGRDGDFAVVAEIDERRVGAAWFRLWTDDDHSYGFVRAGVPELGVAVEPSFRSQGIGRTLVESLLEHARAAGFSAVSLSVSPDNPARRLYEELGFRKVGESGTSWTYLRSLPV